MSLHRTAIGVLLSVAAIGIRAETVVTFDHPENFTDAGDFDHDPKQTRAVIERKLLSLGARYLPPGDSLQITITDINLAGTARIGRSGSTPEVRVMNGGADWPRISVRYAWASGGKPLATVDETIVDRNYLSLRTPPDPNEQLPYEQRMLERWFKERFADRKPPRVR